MTGIANFLSFINNYWIDILVVAALIYFIYKKIVAFIKLSDEEKIEALLTVIKKEILNYMSEAEIDWKDVEKSGAVKKSQVISKIYEKYPELSKIINQEKLIAQIEIIIEQTMTEMNNILNKEKLNEKDEV